MSLKYLLTAVPQLIAALLLLYYACTFSRASSAFAHRMLVNSCLHEGVVGLMLASLLFSAFHLALSVCCSFPALWYALFNCFDHGANRVLPAWHSPVDPTNCQLNQIVACPESVAQLPHFNLCPRLAHTCATFTMLFALSSIQTAHIIKNQYSRVRRANFVTFTRHEPVYEASASVVF